MRKLQHRDFRQPALVIGRAEIWTQASWFQDLSCQSLYFATCMNTCSHPPLSHIWPPPPDQPHTGVSQHFTADYNGDPISPLWKTQEGFWRSYNLWGTLTLTNGGGMNGSIPRQSSYTFSDSPMATGSLWLVALAGLPGKIQDAQFTLNFRQTTNNILL